MKIVKINEDFIKLDSLLKYSGIAATGGIAKMMIKNGEVKVENQICTVRGKKIQKGETIEVSNQIIKTE